MTSHESYHNYIARRYREMDQQLELYFAPRVTQCAHCGDLVHGVDVVVKTYHTNHSTEQEHFCSDACHHEWYIQRLRQWGM